jgi:hypothetical protein
MQKKHILTFCSFFVVFLSLPKVRFLRITLRSFSRRKKLTSYKPRWSKYSVIKNIPICSITHGKNFMVLFTPPELDMIAYAIFILGSSEQLAGPENA